MRRISRSARFSVPSWLLLALIGCATPQALADSVGAARDDRAILGEVARKLFDEQFLGEVAIEVATREGTVWLSGYAARDEDRERALELAGSISGVRKVENDMCILEVDQGCFPQAVP
jgi:osmotically-inducible protein OsmY